MTHRAYLEDDSLMPEHGVASRPPTSTMLDLQLSINAQLMRRLDALEATTAELRKQVKELSYRQAV